MQTATSRLSRVLPDVVTKIRHSAGECSKRHPIVVMVPSNLQPEIVAIALREEGIDAAVGLHQVLAPVRVYTQDQMNRAMDFVARFDPDRDVKIIPVNL